MTIANEQVNVVDGGDGGDDEGVGLMGDESGSGSGRQTGGEVNGWCSGGGKWAGGDARVRGEPR